MRHVSEPTMEETEITNYIQSKIIEQYILFIELCTSKPIDSRY